MSLSGSASGTKVGGWQITMKWTATQNVANNTSTITATAYLVSAATWNINAANKSGYITIDGQKGTFSHNPTTGGGNTQTLGTVTKTVSHAANGTKSLTIGFSYSLNITSGSYGYLGAFSGSSKITLNTIPRATQPSLSAGTIEMGKAVTISLPRASGSFTHKVYFNFGSVSKAIASAAATSVSFTPAVADFAGQIASATSGYGSIWADTYNGSTLIGKKSVKLTLTLPTSVIPTTTAISIAEGNTKVAAILNDGTNFVQNMSVLNESISASGINGSWITASETVISTKTYPSSTNNGRSLSVDLNGQTIAPAQYTIKARTKDSRGRWSAYLTKSITILPYENPSIVLKADRIGADGKPLDEGTIAKLSVSGAVSALINKNAHKITLQYKTLSATDWTAITHGITAYSFDNVVNVNNVSVDDAYQFQATITDSFSTATFALSLSSAFTTVDYRAGGKGIAFGQVATQDGFVVGSKMPLFIMQNTIDGNLVNFIDADYNSLGGVSPEYLNQLNNVGKQLWSGNLVMGAEQIITPTLPLKACLNGWVLVWSNLSGSTAQDSRFFFQHIPKWFAGEYNGNGVTMVIDAPESTTNSAHPATKYLYISNDSFKGYDGNKVGNGAQYTLREVRGY